MHLIILFSLLCQQLQTCREHEWNITYLKINIIYHNVPIFNLLVEVTRQADDENHQSQWSKSFLGSKPCNKVKWHLCTHGHIMIKHKTKWYKEKCMFSNSFFNKLIMTIQHNSKRNRSSDTLFCCVLLQSQTDTSNHR